MNKLLIGSLLAVGVVASNTVRADTGDALLGGLFGVALGVAIADGHDHHHKRVHVYRHPPVRHYHHYAPPRHAYRHHYRHPKGHAYGYWRKHDRRYHRHARRYHHWYHDRHDFDRRGYRGHRWRDHDRRDRHHRRWRHDD